MFTFKPVLRHDFCADVCVRTLRKWLTTCADRMHDALVDALIDMQLMCKDAGAGAPTPTPKL